MTTANIIQWDTLDLPIKDNSIDMIFSDPPYVKDQIITYKWLAEEAYRTLKPGKFIAVMCGGTALNKLMYWFDNAGLTYYWLYQYKLKGQRTGLVWKNAENQKGTDGKKNNKPIVIRTKHILVYSKGRAVARSPTTSLYTAGKADKRWHHWGQNVDSHRYYIDSFSYPGDLVLDPLGGGGTTAVACAILDRSCIIGDLDPIAIDTMKRRMNGETHESLSSLPLFAGVNCTTFVK